MNRPVKILLGLVVGTSLGIVCHLLFPESPFIDSIIKNVAQPVGQIFLRLILMIVVPLVFSCLVLGVYEMADIHSLGRVGVKTLIYTIVASVSSVVIGIALVSWFKPGAGLDPSIVAKAVQNQSQSHVAIAQAASAKSFPEILISLIPKNPLTAAVNALDGDMISLMVFALIFGIALTFVRPPGQPDPFVKALESLRDVSMRIVDFAMALAPIGVAALMFALTARFGWGLLFNLGKYVLVVVFGLAIQQFVVYGILLKTITNTSPFKFFSQIREVVITAFSTASSNATLPTTIRVAEDVLGIDKKLASFVLTIGSTANQNGTALFEGVTVLFLAQVFNVDLSLHQQVMVLFMSVIAGVGTAGVPGGSIPLIVIVLQSVGIPAEGIGIILGVDRFLDMCRTVLNVSGDMVAAYLIDRTERRPKLAKR